MRAHPVNPNRRRRLSNFKSGLLALGLICAGTYMAFAGRLPWAGDHEVRAVVAGAPQVQARTPVRIAGVEVGKVKRMERGPGSAATVTMALSDEALPLHRDATLKIRPRIFLEGNFFIDLRPGSPNAPELPRGGTIPISQTSVPVQLDQVLSTLKDATRQDLRELVRGYADAVEGGGAQALNRALPPAAPAFRGAALSAEALRGRGQGDLPGFIRNGGRTAAAIARDEGRLADLVTGFNRSVRGLGARRERLERSVSELDGLVSEARPALAEIDRLLPGARAFVREARPGIRAAPATLRLANPLLTQAAGLVSPPELPALLAQGRPAIASLARLEPPLTRLLALVTPVTECLRRNAVPTLKSRLDDDHLSTGAPAYRELLSGLTGLSSASQNFTGNGTAVRYHAGFGEQIVSTGDVPSLEEPLVGLSSEPIAGSRPKFPASQPPFRPDVPCTSQRPPDMRAQTGPAPRQTKAKGLSAPRGRLLRELTRRRP